MRIEIDTSADSKDSIKKVIRLLHDLTDEPLSNYSLSQSSPLPAPSQASPSEGFFNLFGPADAPASPPAQAPLAQSTAPASQDGFSTSSRQTVHLRPSRPQAVSILMKTASHGRSTRNTMTLLAWQRSVRIRQLRRPQKSVRSSSSLRIR